MRIRTEQGFTLIELLVVVAVVGILAAISTHQLMRARVAANEASAIGTLKAIANGQSTFAATCGGGYYANELETLVDGKYVSEDANMTPKSGFEFELVPGDESGHQDCGGNQSARSFYITGVPLSGSTGNRGFASNQSGTIWQDVTGAAPAEPFLRTASVMPLQ